MELDRSEVTPLALVKSSLHLHALFLALSFSRDFLKGNRWAFALVFIFKLGNKRVRSSSGQSQNCGRNDFHVRIWGFVLLLVEAAVHISCRNGGGGFALHIIAIVQVRSVHVLNCFNFIPVQHWKEIPQGENSGLNPSIEKTLKQGKTGSQAKMTGFVQTFCEWKTNCRSSMPYCRYGVQLHVPAEKTSGESSPENESYTEVYAIQPCRKKNLKLRQSILISNDSSGEVELKPNLNKTIELDHDYIYVKVVCGSTWLSPCGSTATLTMLWWSSWSITGQTHEKLKSIC